MLSRWLTLGLSLVAFAAATGCQNQGKAMGPNAIEEICGYESEAIERLPCMAETIQCAAGTSQKAYFLNKCTQEQKTVALACAAEQQAVADCLYGELEGKSDRQAEFIRVFGCATTNPTWRAPTAQVKKNQYNPTWDCPAWVTDPNDPQTAALCTVIAAETTSGTLNPEYRSCTASVGINNGDVKIITVDENGVQVPVFCRKEIDNLATCVGAPPATAP